MQVTNASTLTTGYGNSWLRREARKRTLHDDCPTVRPEHHGGTMVVESRWTETGDAQGPRVARARQHGLGQVQLREDTITIGIRDDRREKQGST